MANGSIGVMFDWILNPTVKRVPHSPIPPSALLLCVGLSEIDCAESINVYIH
jgi:hypothetical protein